MRQKPVGTLKIPPDRSSDRRLPRIRDGAVKSAAAEALGELRTDKAVSALLKLFRDTSKTVRETAGTALMTIGEPSVPLFVLDALTDKDFVVRCHAVRALAGQHDDRLSNRPVMGERPSGGRSH